MQFILIKGRFKPKAGIPDYDSVRFLANDFSIWSKLELEDPDLDFGLRLCAGGNRKDTHASERKLLQKFTNF
jgi:hypothetical protein